MISKTPVPASVAENKPLQNSLAKNNPSVVLMDSVGQGPRHAKGIDSSLLHLIRASAGRHEFRQLTVALTHHLVIDAGWWQGPQLGPLHVVFLPGLVWTS